MDKPVKKTYEVEYWSCGKDGHHHRLKKSAEKCMRPKDPRGSFIDLTGQKFGKLTVLRKAKSTAAGHSRFVCACDCGGIHNTLGVLLRKGKTRSCGCIPVGRQSKNAFWEDARYK